jgi:acyl carrier protein
MNNQIFAIIETETGQKVDESTPIDSLGDSLDFLELLLAIDRETGKSVPDNRIIDLHTVGDILRLLVEK